MSNTEDSGSSSSSDESHPTSSPKKSNKRSSTVGAVVSQTMSVTSILKTSNRNNDQPKNEMEDVERGEVSIDIETTESHCTTIVETTTIYTTAIDVNNTYTTSIANGSNTMTPTTIDTISCTCCTLVGSSDVCSKTENLRSDRLDFSLFLLLNDIINHSSHVISHFMLHVSSIQKNIPGETFS